MMGSAGVPQLCTVTPGERGHPRMSWPRIMVIEFPATCVPAVRDVMSARGKPAAGLTTPMSQLTGAVITRRYMSSRVRALPGALAARQCELLASGLK